MKKTNSKKTKKWVQEMILQNTWIQIQTKKGRSILSELNCQGNQWMYSAIVRPIQSPILTVNDSYLKLNNERFKFVGLVRAE